MASATYVGRVAETTAAPLVPASSVTLTTSRAVAAGDALLITLKLSTSLLGGVSASDAAGNTYYIDINLSDGLAMGRTIMLSALNVRALGSGATIKVNFPSSRAYLVSVDEFSGLTARDVISSARGSGSTFSSGNTPTTSQPVDLLFGVVGIESGTAPGWDGGWTALSTLSLGGDHIDAAYQVTTTAGQYAATGTTSGTWMAGIIAFKAITPPDSPPVAHLSVSQLSSPALTVKADGSGSTDSDTTPIASYRFDFGDGSAVVTTTAPTATAQHTYAAAGTYTVTLVVTDTGGHASSPATATINVIATSPDNPPVARLSVSQLSNPALTVEADGSASADSDATPIASYRFDFGDGSAAVTTTPPTATAQHTYAAAGTYTVTLIVTDTGGHASSPATATIDVSPGTTDDPPVARLSVSQLSSPALTVRADGSGSTDSDATPIASYRFDFGDGSPAVTTTAPTATAQHTYAAAGTYTVALIVTDTGGNASSPATAPIDVTASTGASVAVYAGYYDTHHSVNLKPKPDPWRGSPNVVFAGSPDPGTTNGWDTSALRVDNRSSSSITVGVTVDIGSHHYALWSPQTVPAGGTLILAQTALENFDGSDTNPAGCYGCDPNLCTTAVSHTIPVVNLTMNGTTTTYVDNQQVLNTGGVDASGCPWTGTRNDESHAWQQINPGQPAMQQWAAEAPAFETHGTMGQPVPNPTHGVLTIRFTNPTAGPVRLSVYDVAGRLVVPCVDSVLDAADYNMAMNLAGRAPGLYILALTTPGGTTLRRFTYVH